LNAEVLWEVAIGEGLTSNSNSLVLINQFPFPSSYFQTTVYVPGRLYESGLVVVAIIVPRRHQLLLGMLIVVLQSPLITGRVARLGIELQYHQ
jgi:hypothetical protein